MTIPLIRLVLIPTVTTRMPILLLRGAKNIDVVIDFKAYRVKTVKYNSRTRRNFERAIDNTIPVRPGLHNIQVIRNGRIIYDQRLYIYPNGVQSIYL